MTLPPDDVVLHRLTNCNLASMLQIGEVRP